MANNIKPVSMVAPTVFVFLSILDALNRYQFVRNNPWNAWIWTNRSALFGRFIAWPRILLFRRNGVWRKKDFALNSFRCDPFFSFACDFQRKIPSDNVFPEKSLPFFVHPSCPRLISIELWIGIKFRGKNLCQRKSHIFSCHYVLFALWNIRIPDKMARHSKHAILLKTFSHNPFDLIRPHFRKSLPLILLSIYCCA